MERQTNSESKTISTLKHMEGAKISIQMQMEVHLLNLCKHKKAEKHALKGKQRSECIHFSFVCQC